MPALERVTDLAADPEVRVVEDSAVAQGVEVVASADAAVEAVVVGEEADRAARTLIIDEAPTMAVTPASATGGGNSNG